MMLGEPRVVAALRREQGLLDRDAEDALVVLGRILDRDIHGQNHGREIHRLTPPRPAFPLLGRGRGRFKRLRQSRSAYLPGVMPHSAKILAASGVVRYLSS